MIRCLFVYPPYFVQMINCVSDKDKDHRPVILILVKVVKFCNLNLGKPQKKPFS